MLLYLAMIEDPKEQSRFEEIYYRYKDFMLTVANSILHNDHDAEEAVHDAFVSVARNLNKVEELDSLKTKGFIAIITERKAINLYHRRKRHAVTELFEEGIGEDDLASEHANPARRQKLSKAIAVLPPRYREIILLKYYHGYTTSECATLLELTPETAGKLDQRAKNRLLQVCKVEGLL